jgi:hypothetical protein
MSEAILLPQATPLVANRFAMITGQALLAVGDGAGRMDLSYLLRFLPFVEHRSVFELSPRCCGIARICGRSRSLCAVLVLQKGF